MHNTLLVTIRGSQRSVDVAMPGDARVGELLPLLREMCDIVGHDADGAWRASARRLHAVRLGRPLKTELTFFEGDVRSGDVLTFQETDWLQDSNDDIHYTLSQDFVPGEFVSLLRVAREMESRG
jgi:hypothetical protein